MKLLHILCLAFSMTLLSGNLSGQKHRFNFAQSYLGAQLGYLPVNKQSGTDYLMPRLVLGGTHFWYRADFYISFPLFPTALHSSNQSFSEGVITGARYLPFGPGKKWPLPFVGIQWMTPVFQQGDGPEMQRNRLGLEFGLSAVVRKKQTLELSIQHMTRSRWNYPVSRIEITPIAMPAWNVSLCFKKYIDITAGNATPQGQQWLTSAHKTFETLGALSGWSVAVGLSSNVPLSNYSFAERTTYFPPAPRATLIPDVALGYYWHKPDVEVRIAWRPAKLSQSAHGHQWKMTEHRVGFEAFKFLFDYHGFVPFLGFSVGTVHQNFSESDEETQLYKHNGWRLAAGFVFGWDIRPTDAEWFLLRTNLRYLPPIGASHHERTLNAHHLEVNFIQVVIYPKRLSNLKNIK